VPNRSFPRFLILLAVVVLNPWARAANPRAVDTTIFGDSLKLGPELLFHPGDDPRWAAPGFDDRDWTVVSTERELTSYGFRNLRYGWYRVHIHLRPGTPAPVIVTGNVFGAYEIYAGGIRIGGDGPMNSHAYRLQRRLLDFPVPQQIAAGGDIVIAIRCAINLVGYSGPGTSTPFDHGSLLDLDTGGGFQNSERYSVTLSSLNSLVLGGLALLIAIVALALGIALSERREYLAAAAFLLADSAIQVLHSSASWLDYSWVIYVPDGVLNGIAYVSVIEFVRLVVDQPRRRWILVIEAVVFIPTFSNLFGFWANTLFLYRLGFLLYFVPLFALNIGLLILLADAFRMGNKEARFLLPAVLIYGLPSYWGFCVWTLYYVGITARVDPEPFWFLGPYRFTLIDVCEGIFLAAILLFLVLRTLRIARHNAQVNAELQAARATQRLLLAASAEPTPGFDVQTVYHPASEVGGDFFAVQPAGNGSLLITVGDVSGKGMNAAMTVSEILGALRGCELERPSEILNYLNRILRGQTAGFITCCVALISPVGELAIANAGHLPPYLDGDELPVDPGLPLGVAQGVSWPETVHSLGGSERLTFVSDGVVEARSVTGELFGFDRTRAVSRRTAEEIASAARAFGQEDDITVLSVSLIAVPAAQ
jgi:phosphoserine phosphatase RsbU/P